MNRSCQIIEQLFESTEKVGTLYITIPKEAGTKINDVERDSKAGLYEIELPAKLNGKEFRLYTRYTCDKGITKQYIAVAMHDQYKKLVYDKIKIDGSLVRPKTGKEETAPKQLVSRLLGESDATVRWLTPPSDDEMYTFAAIVETGGNIYSIRSSETGASESTTTVVAVSKDGKTIPAPAGTDFDAIIKIARLDAEENFGQDVGSQVGGGWGNPIDDRSTGTRYEVVWSQHDEEAALEEACGPGESIDSYDEVDDLDEPVKLADGCGTVTKCAMVTGDGYVKVGLVSPDGKKVIHTVMVDFDDDGEGLAASDAAQDAKHQSIALAAKRAIGESKNAKKVARDFFNKLINDKVVWSYAKRNSDDSVDRIVLMHQQRWTEKFGTDMPSDVEEHIQQLVYDGIF
jgi:hypothetical protein